MIGVVDVGGGLRGIYGAGVFDYCMDHNIHFDYGIGVSAGSANIFSFAAGQKGRNYHYFIDYSFRPEYMSLGNLIRKGSYLDMDYIYGTLYNASGERPLDYPAIARSDMILKAVATNALTGMPTYFSKEDLHQDDYDIIKASCSIPVVNRPYMIHGIPYYDGGISDPVPVRKAFQDGCDRVVLILTKPLDFSPAPVKNSFFSHFIEKQYPLSAQLVRSRNHLYQSQLRELRQDVQDGRLLIIAPKTIYGMKTLTKDKKILHQLYLDGMADAACISRFLRSE